MRSEKVNENRPMKEERHPDKAMRDSDDSIRRGGGEDPRRHEAKIMIDRKVSDHSQSGYNHNGVIDKPQAAVGNNEYKAMKDAEVSRTPEIQPDGLMGHGGMGKRY